MVKMNFFYGLVFVSNCLFCAEHASSDSKILNQVNCAQNKEREKKIYSQADEYVKAMRSGGIKYSAGKIELLNAPDAQELVNKKDKLAKL